MHTASTLEGSVPKQSIRKYISIKVYIGGVKKYTYVYAPCANEAADIKIDAWTSQSDDA